MKKSKKDILPIKQEKFCLAFIESGDAVASYKSAYNTKSGTTAIRNNASRLMATPKVMNRLQELRTQMARSYNVTKNDVLEVLMNIVNIEQSNGKHATVINAVKEINKMLGFYAPTESKVEINSEQPLFGPDEE